VSRRRMGAGALDLGGLTPLLDTVFLLIFALLALSRDGEVTELVRVELPMVDPERDTAPGTQARIVLVIDAASVVRLPVAAAEGGAARAAGPVGEPATGRMIATREALDAALAAELDGLLPEEVVVEIQADANARHGVAVELLQHLRLAGFCEVELLAIGTPEGSGGFGAFGQRGGTTR